MEGARFLVGPTCLIRKVLGFPIWKVLAFLVGPTCLIRQVLGFPIWKVLAISTCLIWV